MKIQFEGAARTVTGSKFILETDDGLKILLDCGMYQGRSEAKGNKNRHLGFDPASIDFVILSHAHIDHSGMLPRIVKEGFKGNIYCTEPTDALCQIMLADSAHIQQSDYRFKHKHHFADEEDEPLYDIDDVVATMELFRPLSYNEWHSLHDDVALMFTYVGHILGSGCVNLRVKEGKKTHRIAYTGDIGRKSQQIIKGWEPFPQAEIVITESTYGDRLHEDPGSTLEHLRRIVVETCVENKGKLIIPAFSLGRTQEIVHALDKLESRGKLPPIKVFVDSPLSTNATDIVKSFPEHYNDELRKYMERDSNPFGFAHLHYIRDVKYSKLLNSLDEPCIIISASGMVEAGRILHHVRNNIENERNTLLFVGYCEPSSLGGRLRDGAETIKMFGQELKVKARIEIMDSYSAHGDYEEMIEFLKCQEPHLIKQLFLVHGTYDRQVKYREHLTQAGFHHIHIPEEDEVFEV
jgi:metallo-beta-lactamase family protein